MAFVHFSYPFQLEQDLLYNLFVLQSSNLAVRYSFTRGENRVEPEWVLLIAHPIWRGCAFDDSAEDAVKVAADCLRATSTDANFAAHSFLILSYKLSLVSRSAEFVVCLPKPRCNSRSENKSKAWVHPGNEHSRRVGLPSGAGSLFEGKIFFFGFSSLSLVGSKNDFVASSV